MNLKSALEHLRKAAKTMLKEKEKGINCESTCHCAFCELEYALTCTALPKDNGNDTVLTKG